MRNRGWLALATLSVAALGVAFVLGLAQDEGPVRRAGSEPRGAACVFHSIRLMPVADSKALGYTNNSKFLVDRAGTGYVALRSKLQGEFNICLARLAGPWRDGMPLQQTWLEDRDSVLLSAAPQRPAAIAAGEDGSIHMAWYGGSGSSPEHQIRYARFVAGEPTRIAEESTPFTVPGFAAVSAALPSPIELWQEHAAVAVGHDGTTHVAWEARDPFRPSRDGTPRPGIAYATRSREGAWSVSGVLDRPPYLQVDGRFPSQSRPTILVDGSGLVHVLCYGSMDGVQQILHGTIVGSGFSGWKAVRPSSGDQRHVAAALDTRGRLHVAWREGVAPGSAGASSIAVFYSMRETDGSWHRATRLSAGDENASTPSVGVTDSYVSVAWVAWSPGATNSAGMVDNGFPSDNSTVEGRLEVSSAPMDLVRFGGVSVIDPGRASYPSWAVLPACAGVRPPLVWVGVDPTDRCELRLGWCERSR